MFCCTLAIKHSAQSMMGYYSKPLRDLIHDIKSEVLNLKDKMTKYMDFTSKEAEFDKIWLRFPSVG